MNSDTRLRHLGIALGLFLLAAVFVGCDEKENSKTSVLIGCVASDYYDVEPGGFGAGIEFTFFSDGAFVVANKAVSIDGKLTRFQRHFRECFAAIGPNAKRAFNEEFGPRRPGMIEAPFECEEPLVTQISLAAFSPDQADKAHTFDTRIEFEDSGETASIRVTFLSGLAAQTLNWWATADDCTARGEFFDWLQGVTPGSEEP